MANAPRVIAAVRRRGHRGLRLCDQRCLRQAAGRRRRAELPVVAGHHLARARAASRGASAHRGPQPRHPRRRDARLRRVGGLRGRPARGRRVDRHAPGCAVRELPAAPGVSRRGRPPAPPGPRLPGHELFRLRSRHRTPGDVGLGSRWATSSGLEARRDPAGRARRVLQPRQGGERRAGGGQASSSWRPTRSGRGVPSGTLGGPGIGIPVVVASTRALGGDPRQTRAS